MWLQGGGRYERERKRGREGLIEGEREGGERKREGGLEGEREVREVNHVSPLSIIIGRKKLSLGFMSLYVCCVCMFSLSVNPEKESS